MALPLSLQGLLKVFFFLLSVLSLAQALDTLYVKPAPDTPCDEDPCLTLMEYVDNFNQHFTRDTEAVFLPGKHLLGRTILVSDITHFTMRKEKYVSQSHPAIFCTAAVGIAFINVSFVSITELSFVSCGNIIALAPTTWVLYAEFIGLFVMANVTIKMSHATAVFSTRSTFYSFGNHFQDNSNNGIVGGGIVAIRCNVSIENNQFYNNFASGLSGSGGGAVVIALSVTVFSGMNIFADNEAGHGGGIYLANSYVSFEGSNTFMHNSASEDGGAIASQQSVVTFSGNTTFVNNSAYSKNESSAAALSLFGDLAIFTGNTTFLRNGPSPTTLVFVNSTAFIEGIFTFNYNQGEFAALNSSITITGMANFIKNSGTVDPGTALDVSQSTLTFFGTTLFAGNSPKIEGGWGAVGVTSSTIQFIGQSTFIDNTGSSGAAIFAIQARVGFNGTQSFENNVASIQGGAIFMLDSVVSMKGYSSFIRNSAGRQGGAISNANGQLNVTGNVTITGNQAPLGGGLYFEYISQILLTRPLELIFQNNSAERGGAISVGDDTNNILCFNNTALTVPTAIGSCFIDVESLSTDIQFEFSGNTASDGGENVFGGMLDKCFLNNNLLSPTYGLSLLLSKVNISTISSEPLRLCFCINGKENCTYEPPPFSIVRGATISVSAVAVDQVNNTVAATIQSYFPYKKGAVSDFSLGQGVQQIGATCSLLNYTILTTASYLTFILYAEGPCKDIGNSQRQITVNLLPCPIAFQLSGAYCICEGRLQSFTNSCSAESQTFSRSTNFWVGTDYRDSNYTGLILHPHCPLDYCISNPANISVNDLDSQCSFNRSGILCGSCQGSLSLVLGSSQCLRCSNSYLALLIPFAVAGVALVFILFILKLTISNGTLSGLIFYANIVAVNKEIFFPPRTTNILTVFIAWLNLDLGIETCFFNGMDTYARTWLQYAFPFYIWLLVFIIIVTSHYSVRVPKLLGRNPIAVLATLFLLSYTKLLRAIIASFSATVLHYPDNTTETVWLYDGNIQYMRGKHIPLFLFSLAVLLLFFLPYTVLLLLSQLLQALSNKKYLFWMNSLRMKTFLDAYHAPYNIKHRYWTGLLLVLRCVLFLVFASNSSGDLSVNLLAIASVALCLAVSTRVTGQVYSKWWLDVLEGSFILNLGVLAAATYHVMQSGGNQSAVAYLSVSVAFIEFIGIIIYVQLKYTSTGKKICNTIKMYLFSQKSSEKVDNSSSTTENRSIHTSVPVTEVSLSALQMQELAELREPVIDMQES